MEIRYRASVARTSKGYSVDGTVEMTNPDVQAPIQADEQRDEVVRRIKEFMGVLETAFPREVEG